MRLSDDLSPRWIYVKGLLFLGILLISAIGLVLEDNRWLRLALVIALIWSSARLYYFMFYVIEKYVDETYKFSGIWSFLRFLLARRKP